MADGKRKRTHKVSKGLRKHRKAPLSVVQRVLAGKGLLASIKPVEAKTAWRGVGSVRTPYDAAQVEINRKLYPHLFMEAAR